MKRLLPVLVGLVVLAGGGYLLLTVVSARDAADVGAGAASGPGVREPDAGSRNEDGAGVGEFTSPAPTSGTHARRTPTREGRIDDAQLLTALALGNVAFVHAGRPPAALRALQERVATPFDPEIAAAGQAVMLVRRDGTEGVQALAWRHRLQADGPDDPALGDFAQDWLGQGAPG